jgi:hypothetical protein
LPRVVKALLDQLLAAKIFGVLPYRISLLVTAVPDHIWTEVLRIFEALLFGERIGCGRHVNERQSIR